MLHDPEMECTCDGETCSESVFLPMRWTVGGYDLRDSEAKELLEEQDWSTVENKHYCENCKEAE